MAMTNKIPLFTVSDTLGTQACTAATITQAGQDILDDANAAAQLTTLGIGNVSNTADADKPVSTATQTALDAKAALSHSHVAGDVTGTAVLTADARLSDARTPLAHATSHTTGADKIATGTPDGTKFLRDDFSWQAASGGVAWGAVTGILADQTDLQAALDAKAAALGADDNYVTDAEKVVIGNTSGTNTGNQTSIVGITGTIAQFNTACTDADLAVVGAAPAAHATSHKSGGADAIKLDELAAPTGSVGFNGQQATSFRIENRTSDPISPTAGQVWLRTDL